MLEPVKAPADTVAITQVLSLLSDLRAEEFAADSKSDGKPFGLDHPALVVSWVSESTQGGSADRKTRPGESASSARTTGALKIGKQVPGKPGTFYASVDSKPFVFTLGTAAVQALAAEFHETQVISLPPGSIRRLVFRLPLRTLAFVRVAKPTGSPADWSPEPGTDASKVDLSRFNDLVLHLTQLRTPRFLQYEGPFPTSAGLSRPRLSLEFSTADGKSQTIRFGETSGAMVLAAPGTGAQAPSSCFRLPPGTP